MLLLDLPGLPCVVSHDEVEAIGAADTAQAAVDLDRELGFAADDCRSVQDGVR